MSAFPYYAGAKTQRGHGLGSLLGGLMRVAMPLVKSGAKTLGKQALKTGMRSVKSLVRDVAQGQNVKVAAKSALKQAGRDILKDLVNTAAINGSAPRRRVSRGGTKKRVRARSAPSQRRRKKQKRVHHNDIFA